MKTVLITGSDGFTGRYVADLFRRSGDRVVGLVYMDPGKDEVACDLTDGDSVRGVMARLRPDGVIHLAAPSFVEHKDQMAFYAVNVFGTLNLLEAMDAEGLKPEKVVIASSANVYGNSTADVITEATPPVPVNHYAASKLTMEFMVGTWFERFPIIITRPFNYTGPGQAPNFLVPKIVDHYRAHAPEIELGNLDVARDFSDVRDIATAYQKLYESGARSEVVNLTSGRAYKLKEIIGLMDGIAGYSIKVTINPDFVRSNEVKVLHGSNGKLRSLTGFVPQIPFEKTLEDMFNA